MQDIKPNTPAIKLSDIGVGHETKTALSLEELNWFTNALAKAKAAAAAEAAKIKHAAAVAAEHAKEKLHDDAVAIKQHLHDDIAAAKTAAAHFAALSKDAAKEMIMEASAAAKVEGAKLANQLIDDAEAQGHVLDAEAKDKILALSIAVGQSASDKVGAADQKVNDMLDSHRNQFTSGIIDYLEAKGETLTKTGQAQAVALAAILDGKANAKVDGIDSKIDSILDGHRPVAAAILLI